MFSNPSRDERPYDRDELRKSRKIVDKLGEYYRINEPKDFDAVWDYLNDNHHESNVDRRAIHYAYMADHLDQGYDRRDFEDAGRDKLEFEEIQWFMEEQDIVTQEDHERVYADEMGLIEAREESSMDRNDPMFELDDKIFVVDIEEDDEEAFTIDVSDVDNGCEEGIIAAAKIRNDLMTLISDEDINPKNAYCVMIMANCQKIEGLLRGMKSCDVGEHHG